MTTVRPSPCDACPYRKDVPSGVWHHDEYEKLRPYDNPTPEQPFAPFACHATPKHYCHGWAVVHTNRGHEFDLIALRIHPCHVPPAAVPLFESGNAAADHGQKDVKKPSPAAVKVSTTLVKRHKRLREGK